MQPLTLSLIQTSTHWHAPHANRALFEDWFAEVRRRRGVEGSAPPWAEIEATPALGRSVCGELRESYERLQAGRAVDLVRLHNILQAAREAIG